ncbi:Hint domain-containing protein [Pyxidicoccus sp. MSG2]|uniref:Hint domain-containing protein n=1 Tax=Pyxidicoccus sp. MSG2 TaxID=2996790 RepID=UPI0022714AC4|nr:Hint domain-containing protein [Pyxidicoccus sp. MSG2]MCY1019996.1 Hint domain-containing protein [Pyxidicoccus sp. MSG2]
MKRLSYLAALACVVLSTTASAQLATRCFTDDQLTTTTLSQGRNNWSYKCGYISAAKRDFLNSEGEYQVYSGGCYSFAVTGATATCTFFIPADVNAPCVANLVKLGTCVTGCYTAREKVAFDGKYWPIEDAYAAGVKSVTALTRDALLESPSTGEQAIRTFVAGDTVEDVFAIQTADGRRVEVTSEHPMVIASGEMVKAKTLKKGDLLLGTRGEKVEISDISVFRYEGKTWNVQPVSHEKIENVLDVKGLLTGSVRFQNEWADDHYRLSLRDEASVDGI